MASWLSSEQGSRGRGSHDIRKYIRVHGRVLNQNNSATKPEDTDSDDFIIMTSQQTRPRPTKQLTLMDFKRKRQPTPPPSTSSSEIKEDTTRERENDQSRPSHRLFLPALKFSTGVRRKATIEEADKENVQSQEAESPEKAGSATHHRVVGSPLRGMNRRSPCSVEKKPPKRDTHCHGSSTSQLPTHHNKQGKRKRSEQKKNEVVGMEQSDHFLSSRKRRAIKDNHQSLLPPKASFCEAKRAAGQVAAAAARVKPQEHGDISTAATGGRLKDTQGQSGNEEKLGTLESSDSDVYINTDELLAELSNCEKNLLSSNSNNF
jgi:hypothetical protein